MQLLRETVDLGQWQRAVKAVLKQAQEGNLKAFSALAKFLLPLPAQRLKISEEPQEEFRVAGMTAGEVNAKMLKRLMDKIEERRVYEDQLAHAGVAGYERSNGTGRTRAKRPATTRSSRKPKRAATQPRKP